MLSLKEISRIRAATLHLLISVIVAFMVLGAMLALWYPPPYFQVMGGKELIALIVGVDVALGPLLTLVVFDTRKKSLPFDLSFIAALQLAALCYGVYAMQAGRPVFTVFTGERFVVMSAAEIEPEELSKATRKEFSRLSLTGPQVVATVSPKESNEREKIAFAGLFGYGIQNLPHYYVPYADQKSEVLKAARTLDDIRLPSGTDDSTNKAADYLKRSSRPPDSVRYLAVKTHDGTKLGVVDAVSAELLDIL